MRIRRELVARRFMLDEDEASMLEPLALDPLDTDGSTVPAALPLVLPLVPMLPLVRMLSLMAPEVPMAPDVPVDPAAPVDPEVPIDPDVPLGLMVLPLGLVVVLLGFIVPLGAVVLLGDVVLLPGAVVVSAGVVELGAGASGVRVVSPGAGVVVGGCVPAGEVLGLVGLVLGLVDGVPLGVVWAAATALPSVSASTVPTVRVRCIIGKSPWRGAPGPLASTGIVTRSVGHPAQQHQEHGSSRAAKLHSDIKSWRKRHVDVRAVT